MVEEQTYLLTIINMVLFAVALEAAIRVTRALAQDRPIGWSADADRYILLFLRIGAIGCVFMGLFFIYSLALAITATPEQIAEIAAQSNLDPESIALEATAVFIGCAFYCSIISLMIMIWARRRKAGEIVGVALYSIPIQTGIYAFVMLVFGGADSFVLGAIIAALTFVLWRWANSIFVRLVQ